MKTGKQIKSLLSMYWLFLFLVLVCAVFAVMQPRFLQVNNIMDIINSTSVAGIAGLGLMIVMLTGELDYCCGMELASGACILARLLDTSVDSYVLAVVITLACMVVIGAVNGALHVYVGIPSFVATIGTSFVLTGLMKWITGGTRYYSPNWPPAFTWLGKTRLFGVLPVSVLCFLGLAAAIWIYTMNTVAGKKLYAIGSNATACKFVGINTARDKMKAFILCSVLCGTAGIICGSMMNSANYNLGASTLTDGLTMLLLGTTFWKLGVLNVPGGVVGAILVATIENGLTMAGAATFLQYLIKGVMLIASIAVSALIKKKK